MEKEKKEKEKKKKASSFASSVQSTILTCRNTAGSDPKHTTRLTSWDMNIAWSQSSPLFHGLIETW